MPKLQKVSTTIRAEEVTILDALAAELDPPYRNNRAAVVRELIREALEARGI